MTQNNNQKLPQITRKTLLYQSGVEYAGYALNHAEGCSHGCHFPCYAMMLKKRCGKVKDYDDWRQPKIVANALELLEKEIPKLKHNPTPNIVKQDIHEVLEAVSFVDKIVFGKWNYNKLISYFNDEKEFYNETAKEVLSFCRKKGIGVHIKDGTITSNGKSATRKMIFNTPEQKALFEVSA